MASGRCDAMRAMPRIPLPHTPTLWTLLRPRILPPCPLFPHRCGFSPRERGRTNTGVGVYRRQSNVDWKILMGLSIRRSLFLSNVDGEDAFSIAIRSGIPMNYIYIIFLLPPKKPKLSFDVTLVLLILIGEDHEYEVMRRRVSHINQGIDTMLNNL